MRRRVRVGVIGAGSWATAVQLPFLAARDDVDLLVVSRRDGALARKIADRFGVPHATDDPAEALRFGLDAVVVATPPNVHRQLVDDALESGAHVLCEKPFAISSSDAWQMVAAARAAHRSLLVSFGWNYTPLMQAVRSALRNPGIGAIEFMTVSIRIAGRGLLMSGRPYHGASELVPPNPETFLRPDVSGGGQAPVTMSHVFGLALFLTGLDAVSVSAKMWNGPLAVDVHDAMLVTFGGGAVAAITGASTHDAQRETEWSISVIGSGGQLQLESATRDLHLVPAEGAVRRFAVPSEPFEHVTTGPLEALLASAKGDPLGEEGRAELGARTVELVEASYRSVRSGRDETIDAAARVTTSEAHATAAPRPQEQPHAESNKRRR